MNTKKMSLCKIKKDALIIVAEEIRDIAIKIYVENFYAEHISESDKINNLIKSFNYAQRVEEGLETSNLTVLQNMFKIIIGKTIPILPERIEVIKNENI